jgi:hypothetical protein
MRDIVSKSYTDDEFHVLTLTQPVRIVLGKMAEGFIISSPEKEIYFGWDYGDPSEFTPENAMLLKPFDNMKDFKKITFTHLYLMPREQAAKVYICIQK